MKSGKKKIVVFTGAGISAESGIKTFRDSDGLWETYKIEDVATFDGWKKNKELVLDFYNQRRKDVLAAQPNDAHKELVKLEEKYDVQIITQNIDDLHERAGSSKILHLHGEIFKSRSTVDSNLVYPINGWELKLGEKCEKGSQLRPHVIWFEEIVPDMFKANSFAFEADIFIVVGTSLQVYPAAGIFQYVNPDIPKYYIDPNAIELRHLKKLNIIKEKATTGVAKIVKKLLKEAK